MKEELMAVVDEAIQRWSASGLLDAGQLEILHNTNFEIADLSGSILGLATADTVYIDSNAAGYGWYVDYTPADDDGFILDESGYQVADSDSEAFGHIDLLSVLLHEIGHILGFEHDSDLDMMDEVLDAGTRYADFTESEEIQSGEAYDVDTITFEMAITLTDILSDHGVIKERFDSGWFFKMKTGITPRVPAWRIGSQATEESR